MKPLKVLVAEDDMVGRRILQNFLEPYATCELTEDGEQALAAFKSAADKETPFNLVILDIGMPKLPGIDVLKSIREYERTNRVPIDKQIKAIMLTGKPDVDNINIATLLGVGAYLIKPVEEKVLIRELQRIGFLEDKLDQWD